VLQLVLMLVLLRLLNVYLCLLLVLLVLVVPRRWLRWLLGLGLRGLPSLVLRQLMRLHLLPKADADEVDDRAEPRPGTAASLTTSVLHSHSNRRRRGSHLWRGSRLRGSRL